MAYREFDGGAKAAAEALADALRKLADDVIATANGDCEARQRVRNMVDLHWGCLVVGPQRAVDAVFDS